MKLGGFWGMTAPMFVLAFPQKEDAVPFFNEMRKYSNKEALKGLQKELLFLKKIETFKVLKCSINLEEIETDTWEAGKGLQKFPEYNQILKNAVEQECLVRLYEREQAGRSKDLSNLKKAIEDGLTTTFPVKDRKKVVSKIVSTLPSGASSISNWMHENDIAMDWTVADSAIVNGEKHELTTEEKSIVGYFIKRLDDVQYWIDNLVYTSVKQETVYGMLLEVFIQRNPKSIRYAVAAEFEQIKDLNDRKVLLDKCREVREDTLKFKKLYNEYVLTTNGSKAVTDSVMPSAGLRELLPTGFNFFNLPDEDRDLLNRIYDRCSMLSQEKIAKTLGCSANLNEVGKSMVRLGICGLNGCQLALLQEAIANTILSPNKFYVDQEVYDEVNSILDNDVLCMLDSILPVGEVLV